jgi:hypothetical protein
MYAFLKDIPETKTTANLQTKPIKFQAPSTRSHLIFISIEMKLFDDIFDDKCLCMDNKITKTTSTQ